ncbi:hypothetical protein F4778DRAFT_127205 [Xylariomycetidae sp. FL2044]|nr:hypothetical protein F4778DRAFT_127205 [Xylariomycetidae sp. FL2044]
MASEQMEQTNHATGSAEPTTTDEITEITLHIVSPSVGVPQPLHLPKLSSSTTINQLKEKIRNAIDTRPDHLAQRLIHRGRLLVNGDETILTMFGAEATLHLVLREPPESRPPPSQPSSTSQSPAPGQQPSRPQPNTRPGHHHHHHHHHHNHNHNRHHVHNPIQPPVFHAPPQFRVGPQQFPAMPWGPSGMNAPGQPMNQQLAEQQRQWLAVIQQNQRDHATMGGNGTPGAPPQGSQPVRTVVREGVGPNGQHWRITVNETIGHSVQWQPSAGSPFPDIRPDMSNMPTPRVVLPRATPNGSLTDASRRNLSTSSLPNLATSQPQQTIPPGVTAPSVSLTSGSSASTPRSASRPRNTSSNHRPAQTSMDTPEVYILSSPTGPRALLLNSSLDTYFSPPVRPVHQPMGLPNGQWPFTTTFGNSFNMPLPQMQQPHGLGRNVASTPVPNVAPQTPHAPGQPPAGLPQPPIAHAAARQDNAQIQAIRIAQVWPHIWMIIRLGLFIWWFTTPTSSWLRWFTVIFFSTLLLLGHLGVLAPLAEQGWNPVRRHLENMIPLGEDHPARNRAPGIENGRGGNGAIEPERNLDPADTAARLVHQRRQANANWLMNQARRLERAGMLFLASIAPGVAERHIAHMEAEAARAERQRAEAEAAAAAEAAASAQNENSSVSGADRQNRGEGGEQPEADGVGNGRAAGEHEPLIAT